MPLHVSVIVAPKEDPATVRLESRGCYLVAAVIDSLSCLFTVQRSDLQPAKDQPSAAVGHF